MEQLNTRSVNVENKSDSGQHVSPTLILLSKNCDEGDTMVSAYTWVTEAIFATFSLGDPKRFLAKWPMNMGLEGMECPMYLVVALCDVTLFRSR